MEFDYKNKKHLFFLLVIISLTMLIVSSSIPDKHRMTFYIGIFIVLLIVIGVFLFDKILQKIMKKDISKYGRSKEDYKVDKEYYREILKISSPLVIGFVDDMELEISENEIIAELLYLKEKNIIDFQNDKIVRLNHGDTENLLACDRFFMSKIIDGKLKIKDDSFFIMRLKGEILQDSKNKFELVYNKKMLYDKHIIILFVVMILGAFLKNIDFISDFIGDIFVLIPLIYLCVLWTEKTIKSGKDSKENILFKVDVRKRTKYGEELNKKIEGLKIFLKDYSMLNEKSSELIAIWEEYMVYSVLFGQNKKIIEEYRKYME